MIKDTEYLTLMLIRETVMTESHDKNLISENIVS